MLGVKRIRIAIVLFFKLLCENIRKQKQSHFAKNSQVALFFTENGGVRQTRTADLFDVNSKRRAFTKYDSLRKASNKAILQHCEQ